MSKLPHKKRQSDVKFSLQTFRISNLLILIPIIIACFTLYFVVDNGLIAQLANQGNSRLITVGWQAAQAALTAEQPHNGTKYSYYKLQEGQNLAWAASHFSVSLALLQKLNPGRAVWGTTIVVPPVEHPFAPFRANQATLSDSKVYVSEGTIYVSNSFTNPEAYMTMPQLMQLLKPYDGIIRLEPKVYMINKPIVVLDNIRVDITSSAVSKLLLRSDPDFNNTTLSFKNSEALIDSVSISSYDRATGKPDTDINDGRSFLRADGNARMDILNSTISYLGMTKSQAAVAAIRAKEPFLSQGADYGVSWRTAENTAGEEIVTGWVEGSTFEHNYIGAYSWGASGMMFKNNLFTKSLVYGLDPHNGSDNATIEYNRFISNDKHGLILSKYCDYNVIKDNISVDNKLHGFMLHDNSDDNLIEGNISIGNYDNFVLYGSSDDTILGNKSYNPRDSNMRINDASTQDYIENNQMYGGATGVYLYGNANGIDIANNVFDHVGNLLVTRGAVRILYAGNTSNQIGYRINKNDRVIFGVNKVNGRLGFDLKPLQLVQSGVAHNDLAKASALAL